MSTDLPSTSSAPASRIIIIIPPEFTLKNITTTPKTTATLAVPTGTYHTVVTATAPAPASTTLAFPTPGNTAEIVPEYTEEAGPVIVFWVVVTLIIVGYICCGLRELYREIEEGIWSWKRHRGQSEERLLSEVELWDLDTHEVEHRGPSEEPRTWPA
ncbi:hypothetical protein FB567DRAFT_612619 [Paraphoma chrysanthemicola]|uniref:Uncharacterized protein n=1 Tax=Paraphoma chrysanthemicola TaxID=798071 RepID=A0A8K0QUK3_9PLEO|nr:hypothetical protein FB567DRAFT_612619 [Paraphoma chrysanthemicola]